MKRFFQAGGSTPSDMQPIGNSNDTNLRLYSTASLSSTNPTLNSLATPGIPLSPFPTPSSQQYFDVAIQPRGVESPIPGMAASMRLGASDVLLPPSQGVAGTGVVEAVTTTSLPVSTSHAIDRTDLHKGLKSLEGLIVTFDEYRDLKTKLAKCEKKLAKGMTELAKSKVVENVPSQTLQSSALMFDSITETTSKHAKVIQKEYESMNEYCGKYFKRVAKEERAHDELLDTLDSKVKKAHAGHEKNAKKSGRVAIESHDRYIQTVQALTQDISRAKANHSVSVGTKTFVASLVVASTLGGIADNEFKALCESVRKSGPHVGKLNEWLNFASTEGMGAIQPVDLNDEAMGWAQALAIREAEIREEVNRKEQARLAQLEHAQTVWKAQQMGWLPPASAIPAPVSAANRLPKSANASPQPKQREKVSMLDLPKLDSDGREVGTRPSLARLASSKPPPSPSTEASKVVSGEDKSAVLMHEQSRESSIEEGEGTVIDQGPSGLTEAEERNNEREENSIAISASPTKSNVSSSSSSARLHSSAATSFTMSMSNSKSSEDDGSSQTDSGSKSRGPTTPVDEAPPREVFILESTPEKIEGILKKPEATEDIKPTMNRIQAERPVDRYIDINPPKSYGQSGVLQAIETIDQRASPWEQEREREAELLQQRRRHTQVEERARTIDRAGPTTHEDFSYGKPRPRYSEPMQSQRRPQLDEEIPAHRYQPDRYSPAAGTSRVSSGGVNRTLSTDSERSFVARMKAKYQAERDERSSRPANVYFDSPKAAGYTYETTAPSFGARHDSAGGRRVAAGEERELEGKGGHAVGCGCWSCSARHYSSSKGAPTPPPTQRQQSYTHAASQAPPPNYRRQSMPPVRDERATLKAPPAPSRDVHVRRSFEEEASANQERRVMFASKTYR